MFTYKKVETAADDAPPDTRKCLLFQTPTGWYNTAPEEMDDAAVVKLRDTVMNAMSNSSPIFFETEEGRTVILPASILDQTTVSIINYADLFDIVDLDDIDDYDEEDDDDED